MKTLWIALVLGLAFNQLNAQKLNAKNVPIIVKNGLEQNFPETVADWDKEGDNYEASFKQMGQKISVVCDRRGTILEVEQEIGKAELPTLVTELLNKEYSDYDISETAKITSNDVVTYEVEVKKGKEAFDLIYDKQGNILKVEPKGKGKND